MSLALAAADPLTHVVQHIAVDFGDKDSFMRLGYFPVISNHIIMQVVAAALLVFFIPRFVQMRAGSDEIGRLVPRGFGNAIEWICHFLREVIFRPNLGKYTDRFAPYLWSAFFFILTCNLLGMLPLGDWFFFVPGHQIGGTSTGNIWVTGTLALCTLAMCFYHGLRFHGMGYVKHFFMGPPGLNAFIAVLEVAGLLFKTMALAVRLFANMIAGHVLLAVLLGFVGGAIVALGWGFGLVIGILVMVFQVLIHFLELLVAGLQAFIFTVLTTVFIGLAVNIHSDDHEEEHAGDEVVAQD
jgi:F-type H+-transporting ATPase subunit a